MSLIPDNNKVVIVIPSFNEGDRVEQVVKDLKSQGYSRIVVVDDHSDDHSIEPLRKYEITILHHLLNRGAGAATETGLKFCRDHLEFEAVVTIDADTQHDPGDIKHLLEEHFHNNADITIGNRFMNDKSHIPGIRRFYNSIANLTTTILSGKKVTDSQSGFKAFSKKAIKKIVLEQDKYEYCSELFIKAHNHKLKVIDVPVRTYYPDEIKNKGQNLFHGINTFLNLIYSTLFKNN